MTGDTAVKTEAAVKTFSGKGHAMLHERKRMLNKHTASDGLLFPGKSTAGYDDLLGHLLVVPRVADVDAHCGEDSAHSTDSGDEERPRKRRKAIADEDLSDGQDSDNNIDLLAGGDGTVTDGKKLKFTNTYTHRDDWLHRGETLSDIDYYHYARYVDRIEWPRSGTAETFHNRVGVFHHFAKHYPSANTHVQVLRRTPKVVQNVGSTCKRSDVDHGEDNAMYKAYYHSLVHCPCAGECANPLTYMPLLYPHIPDVDRYLMLLQKNPSAKRAVLRFYPAWRARRSEIEVLADRAAKKHAAAMRVGVIQDTTAFKRASIPRSRLLADAERGFDTRMLQVRLLQGMRRINSQRFVCVERIVALLLEFMDVPLPWHAEQPHLAEWQAFSAREILFNLDQSVDAKNMAQEQAKKHASRFIQDDMEVDDVSPDNRRFVVEDIGGDPPDFSDEDQDDELGVKKHPLHLQRDDILHVLARTAERNEKGSIGRPRDAHKDMWAVADIFGDVLDSLQSQVPIRCVQSSGRLGVDFIEALEHQQIVIDRLQNQEDSPGEAACATNDDDSAVPAVLLTEEAAVLLDSAAAAVSGQGPLTLAKALADAATLNADQMGAVVLVANAMQTAWEEQGRPERMSANGKLLRMLLLGGGGCGKTRIINLVLTALFTEYYGPRGVVKAAPTNKAARGILGKTLHTAAKILPNQVHSTDNPNSKAQKNLEYLWAPAGALIIDEAPQSTAVLYNVTAIRSTFGRAAQHKLNLAEYADPGSTFGAMPIVVECGDELQLPPIPASAGLFADLEGTTALQQAGVKIFERKDYVYKLATMKRFTARCSYLSSRKCDSPADAHSPIRSGQCSSLPT